MPLARIAGLLPYHSHVDVDTVVLALNRMIDAANSGATIFYDFYSEEEKAIDPEKRQTGLFHFRGNAGAPFAVIAPGGGFAYVGSVHEGFPYAMKIADHGYHAFVLRYRLGNRKATEDMAAAIDFIEAHAEELSVGRQGYSLWGSSAGARVVANISANGVKAYGGKSDIRPRAVIMAYTGHAVIRKTMRPLSALLANRTILPIPTSCAEGRRKWKGWAYRFHSEWLPVWGTVSDWEPARRRKAGSTKRSVSGKDRWNRNAVEPGPSSERHNTKKTEIRTNVDFCFSFKIIFYLIKLNSISVTFSSTKAFTSFFGISNTTANSP